MALKNMVGTIAHEAVTTAASVVLHPFGTAAKARGLITETAGAGIGLVLGRLGGAPQQAPAPRAELDATVDEVAPVVPAPVEKPVAKVEKPVAKKGPAKRAAAKKAPAKKVAEDPRDHIPGPDLAAFAPPAPEDLPEPIVIEAR